ncbi:uncharacterized protein J4E78_007365 [Alternaria triticimaculans]|uniref:uncharacterized protein n=1 Tax=Alternaria triticimaculans TaxID=297637 RepID=UPI0020C35B3C|nr:uncharacterized protein J4E78_007365 [Alternaria triticimaculans]KAI4654320.1 hypothetical protein J4E78_007365 [Alternaria triticimaculans]
MPNVASDLIPTKAGHLPGILTFLKSGNQVTLTDIRAMFDQVHPGSAADHFEPYEGGYKLTPRSGFVNLIGHLRDEWPEFWIQMREQPIPENLSNMQGPPVQ